MPVARGFEGTPLMMDGVLYITSNNNYAWAIDVRTGRQIWRYRRLLPPALTYGGVNPSNRGFAALGDNVFMGTLDAHVLAFNRDTGKIVWDTVVDDYKVGHALIAAPERRTVRRGCLACRVYLDGADVTRTSFSRSRSAVNSPDPVGLPLALSRYVMMST